MVASNESHNTIFETAIENTLVVVFQPNQGIKKIFRLESRKMENMKDEIKLQPAKLLVKDRTLGN